MLHAAAIRKVSFVYWYGCTLGVDSPSSRVISHCIRNGFPVTAAITAFSLAGVHTVRGKVAPVTERCLRLNDFAEDNVALIPMHQYHLDYYRYRGLRACPNIRRVCIP